MFLDILLHPVFFDGILDGILNTVKIRYRQMLKGISIKQAKPTDKPYKLSDEKGMYLLVNATGKYWRMDYRFDSKRKTLALGIYPGVSLAEAREKRDQARKLLASGTDPMAKRATDKITKQASAENSFQSVALLWWGHWHGDKSERHADDVIRRLKADVFPAIGARPVSEIQAHELVAMVQMISKRGALDHCKTGFANLWAGISVRGGTWNGPTQSSQ